jgi:polysaccharide biosynthesis transport protein
MSEYRDYGDAYLPDRPQAGRRVVPVQYSVLASTGQEFGQPDSSAAQRMWRHKWIVAAATLAGLLGGCAATWLQTPIYRASATLEVQKINENFLNNRDLNPLTPPSSEVDVQTQAKLLQSGHLVERVTRKLVAGAEQVSVPGTSGESTQRAAGFRASDVTWASRTLRISIPERTRVLEISSDSPDAHAAAAFVNSLATEFAEAAAEVRHYDSLQTNKWLNEQIGELKNRLGQSEQELQAYAGKSDLVFMPDKGTIAEAKLQHVQDDLSRTQAELVLRRSRYELASHSPAETLPEILDSASLRDLQMRITELKRQLAELRSSFTPAYYKVERVQAQVATLEPVLEKERENILGRIRNEFLDAQHRENLLVEAYRQQARLVSDQAVRAVHYDILKREVESERQLYATMLTRVKEAGMAAALGTGNIRVADTADIPKEPRSPNPAQNAGVGSVCGFAAGGLLALLKGRASRHIREPGEAGELLNVPELGAIPSAPRLPRLLERRQKIERPPSLISIGDQGPKTGPDRYSEIWAQQFSLVTESFRSLALSILFSEPNCRILAVASPMPMDGKTTVASNLAIGLALKGERVLLVDGDLRKPKLHGLFGTRNEKGLSDLLCKDLPGEQEQLSDFYSETSTPGLFVMPHGSSPAGADALHGPRMMQLLTNLRCDFDRVVIDTPPMLHLADGRILGRAADGVVLVIRANATDRGAAQSAVERFVRDGTPVLGCILNDWNPRKSALGYYDPKKIQRYYSGGTRS